MPLSQFQIDCHSIANHPRGTHALWRARAGSGKTYTIETFAEHIPKFATLRYVCYNKAIADEAKLKLRKYPNVTVSTFHSFGFQLVLQNKSKVSAGLDLKLDTKKNETILREHLGEDSWKSYGRFAAGCFDRAVSLLKDMLWSPEADLDLIDIDMILDDFDLFPSSDFVRAQFNLSATVAELWPVVTDPYPISDSTCLIDFSDQLYLVYKYRLSPAIFHYTAIDEAQDLNNLQRELVYRMAEDSSIIIVGDDWQCIYEFRGASADGMEQMAKALNALRFSLPICYRCPKSVIELAQEFTPDITCPDTAPEGEVLRLSEDQMYPMIQPEDAVIARSNRELVHVAFVLRFVYGKRVWVKGDGTKKSIDAIVEKAKLVRTHSREEALALLDNWHFKKVASRPDHQLPPVLHQAYDALEATLNRFDDVGQAQDFLAQIFSPGGPDSISLSTIHKFKGMEADRVFYINPRLHSDEEPAERRIAYVAITRARKSLFLVRLKKK